MALVWLASLGTANAILVRGGIDPQFTTSGDLVSLYWTAIIQFDVYDSTCLSPGTHYTCPISNLSVKGKLQDKPSGPIVPVDFLSNYSPPPYSLSLAVDSYDQIIGIGTGPIGYASVDMRPSLDIGNAWVQFFLPGSGPFSSSGLSTGTLIVQPCGTGSGTSEEDEVESQSAQNNENEDRGDACNASTDPTTESRLTSDVLGVVHITQVPEPGSLWLVLAALFVAAPLLARRKQLS
ncbi:MAG: PEP-CTERM sorting domain-containing protein [Betaproteobacteria bacterium]|nr:PEP-CTERM sorting domain-containing protein [Betaproteobacteria bacterium]